MPGNLLGGLARPRAIAGEGQPLPLPEELLAPPALRGRQRASQLTPRIDMRQPVKRYFPGAAAVPISVTTVGGVKAGSHIETAAGLQGEGEEGEGEAGEGEAGEGEEGEA